MLNVWPARQPERDNDEGESHVPHGLADLPDCDTNQGYCK